MTVGKECEALKFAYVDMNGTCIERLDDVQALISDRYVRYLQTNTLTDVVANSERHFGISVYDRNWTLTVLNFADQAKSGNAVLTGTEFRANNQKDSLPKARVPKGHLSSRVAQKVAPPPAYTSKLTIICRTREQVYKEFEMPV